MKDNPFKCRYYREKFPKKEDLVMVNVENVQEMGAYVTLLEYSKMEGMVLLSELSRRRIRSINKLIRVGRKEVVLVLRVDSAKGYVDLSKKAVSADDVGEFETKYNKAKHVHSILYNVAKRLNVLLLDLYEVVAWPLYDRFGHAYDAFKASLTHKDKVFTKEMNIPDNVLDAIIRDVKLKMASKPQKIRADIEVQCFTAEGIDAIKAGLISGRDMAKKKYDAEIGIKLVAPPRYVLSMTHMDEKEGIKILTDAIDVVSQVMKKKKSRMVVKMEPRATNQAEDAELQSTMMRLARENEEVAGDDE